MSSPHAYRPDIDGLRAIAIFVVVIYHLGDLSKGGFVGVDVFFVISGYLITSIILHDIDQGKYSLANFYERRIRRIFPALFACLAASMVAAYFLFFPAEFVLLSKSVIAATFFVANLFYIDTSGYFGPLVHTLPLIHTWSLAVEEQFYLFFPLLLVPFLRLGRKAVKVAIALGALVSLVGSELLVRSDPNFAFYHLASRAWELLLGSLLAVGAVPEAKTQRLREILSGLGLVAILVPTFAYNKTTPFPGVWALLPCLGAAALIHTGAKRDTFAARLLSTTPFAGLGLISYSLYLWHVPIITFYRFQNEMQTSFLVKASLFAVSIGVAYLSWRFIEQPFRKKQLAPRRRQVFALGGAAAAGVAVLAVTVIQVDGWEERFSPEIRRLAAFKYNPLEPMREGVCFMSREAARVSEFEQARCLPISADKANVLILGDSHAAHLWSGLNQTFPDVNFLQATASGCSVDFVAGGSQRCRKLMSFIFDSFLPAKQLDAIVISMSWSKDDVPALLRTIERLQAHARAIYVFGPIVKYSSPLPWLLTRSRLHNDPGVIGQGRLKEEFDLDVALRKALEGTNVRYISLIDALCTGGECSTVDENGLPVQFDRVHLTAAGSALLARRLADRLPFSLATSTLQTR